MSKTKEYVTIAGDMWDSIAYKTMGDESYTTALIEKNLQHRNTFIFPAGVKLILPEKKLKFNANLPPWKRSAQT